MAILQKCDGCGDEHTKSKPFSATNNNLSIHKFFVAPESGTIFEGDINENFDLCRTCTKRVVNFIKGGALLPVQEAK